MATFPILLPPPVHREKREYLKKSKNEMDVSAPRTPRTGRAALFAIPYWTHGFFWFFASCRPIGLPWLGRMRDVRRRPCLDSDVYDSK